jgi:hypothetical protein
MKKTTKTSRNHRHNLGGYKPAKAIAKNHKYSGAYKTAKR